MTAPIAMFEGEIDWAKLRTLTKPELAQLGFVAWFAAWNEQGLMLFPASWFDHIPDGFEVEVINGTRRPFSRTTCDRDQRFGCLAYGILAKPG